MSKSNVLERYLEAAVEMGFDGSYWVDGGSLYLQGDACRYLCEETDDAWIEFDGGDAIDIGKVYWTVEDLEESVPAKMVITEDHELFMYGPDGCGQAGEDDFCGWLLHPVQMTGVDDFKRLFPLVIDLLALEQSDEELKDKAMQITELFRELMMREPVEM